MFPTFQYSNNIKPLAISKKGKLLVAFDQDIRIEKKMGVDLIKEIC